MRLKILANAFGFLAFLFLLWGVLVIVNDIINGGA